MKVLYETHMIKSFRLLVNRVKSRKQALKIYSYFTNVADEYLKEVSIDYLGHVKQDETVSDAVMERTLLLNGHPESEAAKCIVGVVDTLNLDEPARSPTGARTTTAGRTRALRPASQQPEQAACGRGPR